MSADELTPDEQRFCEEYAKDKTGVRAALVVWPGLTYGSANQKAISLLQKPTIRQTVKRLLKTQAKRLKAEVPDIVREWAILGKSDLTDYVVDAEGRLGVAPGVPKLALRAVKKFKQLRTEKLHGEALTIEIKTEIELHGKEGPLTSIYEHLHGVLPGDKDRGSTDALADFFAALVARGAQPEPGTGTGGDRAASPAVAPQTGTGGGVHQPGG